MPTQLVPLPVAVTIMFSPCSKVVLLTEKERAGAAKVCAGRSPASSTMNNRMEMTRFVVFEYMENLPDISKNFMWNRLCILHIDIE